MCSYVNIFQFTYKNTFDECRYTKQGLHESQTFVQSIKFVECLEFEFLVKT